MKELLEQIKKYLDDRSDADWDGYDDTHRPNAEMWLLGFIDENKDDPGYMWAELQSYCDDHGLTEWSDQIENYFLNKLI